MKTSWIKFLIFSGCALVVTGMMLLGVGQHTVVSAQDDAPSYEGAKGCSSCHRNLARTHNESAHVLTLQDVDRDKDPILGNFETGDDVRTVQFPEENVPRPFTADDIALAVGSGVHVQRYLYEIDRNEYMVLPAEWNVETQQWQPYQRAEAWPDDAYDWAQNCAYCHTTGFEVERGRWEDEGVQCEACHGPGGDHVEAAQDAGRNPSDEELIEVRSKIYNTPDAQVCGQCHSQGVSSDGHPYPVGYLPGRNLSDSFQLVPTDSADHWWLTGHGKQKYMQYNEWFTSTHATSLSDLTQSFAADDKCLVCHSQDARQVAGLIEAVENGDREGAPLDPLTVENARWGITCQSCHYQHTESEQPFQLVQEANSLCMSCHVNPTDAGGVHHPVAEMFEGISLVAGIDGVAGAHGAAEDGPVCTTCHMQPVPVDVGTRAGHGFTPILPGASDEVPSACAGCHEDLTTTDLRLLVTDTQAAVEGRLKAARAQLEGVEKPQPNTEAMTRYEQASAALDFVENDGSLGVHNYNYVDVLLTTAEQDLAALGAVVAPVEAQPTLVPTAATVPISENAQPVSAPENVSNGFRPVTFVVIGAVIAILLGFAVAFFRKPGA